MYACCLGLLVWQSTQPVLPLHMTSLHLLLCLQEHQEDLFQRSAQAFVQEQGRGQGC